MVKLLWNILGVRFWDTW